MPPYSLKLQNNWNKNTIISLLRKNDETKPIYQQKYTAKWIVGHMI